MDIPSARKTVGGALMHHYRVLCVVVLVMTGAAALAAVVRPPTYQATAILNLDESPNVNGGFDLAVQADQFLSQRYIQMATSRQLLEQVCAGSAIRCSAADLAKRVSATTSKTSGTIQVSVTAGSRFEAAVLANGVANKVVEENRAEIAAASASARAYLQNELQQQSAQIASVQASLRAAQVPGLTEAAVANASAPLLSDLNAAEAQYTAAHTRLTDLDVQQSRLSSSLSVVQAARPPDQPWDPNLLIYVLVGFAASLFLGFLAALLAERFDDRLRGGAQLAEAAGTDLVLDLSRQAAGETEQEAAYALAHASLMASHADLRAVLLVAASPGDRTEEAALGLAQAAAQSSEDVLVLQTEPVAAQPPSAIAVQAAPAGRQAQRELASARERYDLTIACAPPPAHSPRAASLAPAADAAILVATRDRDRFGDVRRTAELLRLAGVPVAGAILMSRPQRWLEPAAVLALPQVSDAAEPV